MLTLKVEALGIHDGIWLIYFNVSGIPQTNTTHHSKIQQLPVNFLKNV